MSLSFIRLYQVIKEVYRRLMICDKCKMKQRHHVSECSPDCEQCVFTLKVKDAREMADIISTFERGGLSPR